MRGMVDFVGIQDRLNLDGTQAEARIREEFEDNQAESRTALQFAGARDAGVNRLWRHTAAHVRPNPWINQSNSLLQYALASHDL